MSPRAKIIRYKGTLYVVPRYFTLADVIESEKRSAEHAKA